MSKEFLLDLLERTIRTIAQTAIALIGTNAVGIADVDWQTVVSGSALAGLLAVLTALAGLKLGASPDDGSLF